MGIALDHPNAPEGKQTHVRTSRIIHRDMVNKTVETMNTMYHLVGQPIG